MTAKLIAWYPLHKDTKDWSGNGNDLTRNGSVHDANCGVFGGSEHFDGSSNQPLSIPLDVMSKALAGGKPFSIAMWVKCDVVASRGFMTGSEASAPSKSLHIGTRPNGGVCFSFYSNDYNSSFIPDIEQWHHYAFVWTGTHKQLWVDSQLYGSQASPPLLIEKVTTASIGSWSSGSYKHNGNMQDFRIYNGAISKKKIKELSQAKILHYDFNQQVFASEVTSITDWAVYPNYTTRLASTKNSVKVQMVGTGLIAINPTGFKCNGKKIRVSGYLTQNGKPVAVTDLSTYGTTVKAHNNPKTGWFCIEESDLASYWLIHASFTSKAVGDIFEFTDLVVEDLSSDTGNNGLIVDRAGLGHDAPTDRRLPHYSKESGIGLGSYLFDDSYIYSSPLQIGGNNQITMAAWVKGTGTGYDGYHIPICFDSTNFEISIPSNGALRTGYLINGTRRCYNWGGGILDDNWHLLVSTYDGKTIRGYIDGAQVGSASHTGTLKQGAFDLRLGQLFKPEGQYASKNLYQSGVQVYATALSAEDVKALYEVKASISKESELSCHAMSEADSRLVTLEVKAICDYQQYGQVYTTGGVLERDFMAWLEADGTLGEIHLTASVYISNLKHTPTTFEFTRANNDMGFYFYFDDKTDWRLGWNEVTLTRYLYDISPTPDWANMNRWEQYATGIQDSTISGDDYIIFKNVRINKMLSRGSIVNGMGVTKQGVLNVGSLCENTFEPTLLDYSTWNVGDTSAVGFSRNGGADENLIGIDVNPQGVLDVMWQTPSNNSGSDADGGFVSGQFNIDKTKAYRFTIWLKRDITGNGSMYWGMYGYNASNAVGLESMSGSDNGNPYFYSGSTPSGGGNEWMLFVGYVYPAGTTTPTYTDDGVYLVDGTKIRSDLTDFRWAADAVTARARSYLYYSTITSTKQSFYKPRVEEMNGSELSIEDILSGSDHVPLVKFYGADGVYNPKAGARRDGTFVASHFSEV